MNMDMYDYLILDVIKAYKRTHKHSISLKDLESEFWTRIEGDVSLNIGQARIGERITNLYLNGMILNKGGYYLTKKGKNELVSQLQ